MEIAIQTLLQITITMSIVTCVLILFLPLLEKRFHPKGIYYSLIILLLGFLIPFRPMFREPALTVPLPVVLKPADAAGQTGLNFNWQAALGANDVTRDGISISILQLLFLIWAIGAAVTLLCCLMKHFKFMKIVRRFSKAVSEQSLKTVLEDEKQVLGIDKNIELKLCAPIDTPMLIGFFHPVILMPDLDLDQMEWQLVIRHELLHYRRRDIWGRALLMLVLAVHWFNPIIYLLAKTTAFYGEASCDAEVTRNTDLDTRQYYSETIIGVIRRNSNLRTVFSTSFYGGKNGMKRRILSIMNMKKKSFGFLIICFVLLGTLGTGMVFAFHADSPAGQQSGINLAGKSDNYRLIAKMSKLNQRMSVAEYTRQINKICKDSGKNFFSLLADTSDEIKTSDPLYAYYSNTLTHTSSEQFARTRGGEERCYSSASAERMKYGADPVREEYYTDAEWEFVKEQGPEVLDFVFVNYVIFYNILDENKVTVAERDRLILAVKKDMQTYLDGLSELKLHSDDFELKFTKKLDSISQKYSSKKMNIIGELQSVDSLGELS